MAASLKSEYNYFEMPQNQSIFVIYDINNNDMRNTDKTTNKSSRITVRLTPYQEQELNRMSKDLQLPKAKLVRYFISDYIKKYKDVAG